MRNLGVLLDHRWKLLSKTDKRHYLVTILDRIPFSRVYQGTKKIRLIGLVISVVLSCRYEPMCERYTSGLGREPSLPLWPLTVATQMFSSGAKESSGQRMTSV